MFYISYVQVMLYQFLPYYVEPCRQQEMTEWFNALICNTKKKIKLQNSRAGEIAGLAEEKVGWER